VTYEIIVVDNASTDNSCGMVKSLFPEVILLMNKSNTGFAKANNQATRLANGDYIFLLNSDTVIRNNAIGILLSFMKKNPRIAVCGPLLLNSDGTVQKSIASFPTPLSIPLNIIFNSNVLRLGKSFQDKYSVNIFDYSKSGEIKKAWLTGAALMIRKAAFVNIGLFDENYFFMMEDVDLCYSFYKRGETMYFVPEAIITHLLGASRKNLSEDQEVYLKRHSLRQKIYYAKKNFTFIPYLLFRFTLFSLTLLNILRRTFDLFTSSSIKPLKCCKKVV